MGDLKAPLTVTAAIILRETSQGMRVLIARRKLDASLEAGRWEFPGGKVEPLEHPEACLKREIREELDLDIKVRRIFDVASHVYETPRGPFHILLLCYLCEASTDEFDCVDVAEARWVSADELPGFDYAVADRATVEKLRAFLKGKLSC